MTLHAIDDFYFIIYKCCDSLNKSMHLIEAGPQEKSCTITARTMHAQIAKTAKIAKVSASCTLFLLFSLFPLSASHFSQIAEKKISLKYSLLNIIYSVFFILSIWCFEKCVCDKIRIVAVKST